MASYPQAAVAARDHQQIRVQLSASQPIRAGQLIKLRLAARYVSDGMPVPLEHCVCTLYVRGGKGVVKANLAIQAVGIKKTAHSLFAMVLFRKAGPVDLTVVGVPAYIGAFRSFTDSVALEVR